MKKRNGIKNKIKRGIFGIALLTLLIGSLTIESNLEVSAIAILISLAIITWYSVANGYFN